MSHFIKEADTDTETGRLSDKSKIQNASNKRQAKGKSKGKKIKEKFKTEDKPEDIENHVQEHWRRWMKTNEARKVKEKHRRSQKRAGKETQTGRRINLQHKTGN